MMITCMIYYMAYGNDPIIEPTPQSTPPTRCPNGSHFQLLHTKINKRSEGFMAEINIDRETAPIRITIFSIFIMINCIKYDGF